MPAFIVLVARIMLQRRGLVGQEMQITTVQNLSTFYNIDLKLKSHLKHYLQTSGTYTAFALLKRRVFGC